MAIGLGGSVSPVNSYGINIENTAGAQDLNYGVKIGDIQGATENYSIYTDAGNIRFGDLATNSTIEPTDNLVMASADGVLKSVSSSDLGASPWDNPDGTVADQTSTNIAYMEGNIGLGIANASERTTATRW